MNTKIYVEGGGDSKELHSRCREGFRRLLVRCGFSGRMPRLVACGSRSAVFNDFSTAHAVSPAGTYVAMLIDSEEPLLDVERTWDHLQRRDGWKAPPGARDEQVLFMTTCMETWIASDRQALHERYGARLRQNSLPDLVDMESRSRRALEDALIRATSGCGTVFAKGRESFMVLARLNPTVLRRYLPSFARCERVLRSRL